MGRPLIEVCVDSMESVREAVKGGADRLELCANLIIGGTTPSQALIREAAKLGVPVHVLIRPRFGDFLFTEDEKREQLEQIAQLKALGAHGAVVGALKPDGSLDVEFLKECRAAAQGLSLTLHRAFDVCRDAEEALEQAIAIGVDTILTSGQKATAIEGAALITQLTAKAGERIVIMPGSGINAGNIAQLRDAAHARAFHLSAKKTVLSDMVFRREGVPMGLPMMSEFERFVTDAGEVAAVRAALEK
ncbi:MAG: copper homeostasis protein CutC [Clostridiales bacterium]|nr:copper homeostasis protein CutC [Clostridiales bacterium]